MIDIFNIEEVKNSLLPTHSICFDPYEISYNITRKDTHKFDNPIGPARVWYGKEFKGHVLYYKNGEYHRNKGPAKITYTGKKEWFINNKLHRFNAPASIYKSNLKQYYEYGKFIKEVY